MTFNHLNNGLVRYSVYTEHSIPAVASWSGTFAFFSLPVQNYRPNKTTRNYLAMICHFWATICHFWAKTRNLLATIRKFWAEFRRNTSWRHLASQRSFESAKTQKEDWFTNLCVLSPTAVFLLLAISIAYKILFQLQLLRISFPNINW